MKHDIFSDMFVIIKNAEAVGKAECMVPASNMIKNALKIIQKHGYIGNFEFIDNGRGGKIKVELLGKINNCNVIKPRFTAKIDELIKFEKRFLPASEVGILILTTQNGIMDQNEAKKQNVGGKLLGFVY